LKTKIFSQNNNS